MNDNGQLGLNHNYNQFEIAIIESFPNISSVHCGGVHTFILTKEGNVYGCGWNEFGQLCLGNNENTSTFTTFVNNVLF